MINNYHPGTILTFLHILSHVTIYLIRWAIQNLSIIYQIFKYSMMFLSYSFSKSQFVLIQLSCWSSPVCGPWGLSTPCCYAIPITYFQTTNLSPPHQLSCSWPQSDNISCTMPRKTGLNISGEPAQLRVSWVVKSLLTLQYCINLVLHLPFFGSQGSLAMWTSSIQPQTETGWLLLAHEDLLSLTTKWYSSEVSEAEWEPYFHDGQETKILCDPELMFNL